MSIQNKEIIFPFCAVQGLPLLKLALLLTAVNPLIGGLLIFGPRGSAKSTLARAVSDLLPVKSGIIPQFVNLPLDVNKRMLNGSLDPKLASISTLKGKTTNISAGLLNKAKGGVLYVNDLNLVPEHIVEQILDSVNSGGNETQEKTYQQSTNEHHVASDDLDTPFTLIGTINPSEGELRPQLQDRFGLIVALDNAYSLDERINIVKIRQAFEAEKHTFCDNYQVKQILLQQQISDAQKLVAEVNCDKQCFTEIASRCQQANVQGLRADIVMHHASIAHAAWCGRTDVELEDIEQVTPLVLQQRSQTRLEKTDSDEQATQ